MPPNVTYGRDAPPGSLNSGVIRLRFQDFNKRKEHLGSFVLNLIREFGRWFATMHPEAKGCFQLKLYKPETLLVTEILSFYTLVEAKGLFTILLYNVNEIGFSMKKVEEKQCKAR